MVTTIYQVVHCWEKDGGFGDAVYIEDIIATCTEKKDAEMIIEAYSNPHVYAEPYDSLTCGYLEIREEKTMTFAEFVKANSRKDCWWIDRDWLS